MTYISWFSDIGLYLEDYFMYKAVTLAGGIREPLLTCSSFIAGRPEAALLFWFFGGFRCGVPLYVVMLVIY